MKITLEVVPHNQQRLGMIGDWFFEGEDLVVRVTDLGDWRFNFLIARHEMDEAILCKHHGVTAKQVDEYDLDNPHNGSSNFADNPFAPYYTEHNDALAAEWIMSRLLNVDWMEYEKRMAIFD